VPVDQGLAELSDNLLFVATLCYVVAMLGYAAEFAFGRRAPRTATALPPIAGGSVDTLPAGVGSGELSGRRTSRRSWAGGVGRASVAVTVLGWGLHVGSVVTRGLSVDRVPWGNMYEYSSVLALAAVSTFLFLLTRQPIRYLGALVMLPVVVQLGIASTALYAPAKPLIPALNSYWLKIHTSAAVLSSGIFMFAFAATVLYLVKDRSERRTGGSSRGALGHLPAAAAIDRVAYRTTAFAFPIWTFAVIAGAIWAGEAWGKYWQWDPKETWAFITWVVYAGYLHARATAGWKGRRAAIVGVVGFVALMFCYYGVNIWIPGLHSYADI
jgi:cytochrome c-type biogenesis protein CcsB